MTAHWQKQEENGNRFFMRLLIGIALLFGRRAVRLLLPFIVAYFFLVAKSARMHSIKYLRKVLHREPNWRECYRHLFTFAQVSVDRIFFLSKRFSGFDFHLHGEQIFTERQNTGAILAVSHVGSFDVMRALAARDLGDRVEVYPVLDIEHNSKSMSFLQALDPELASRIIDARTPGPELVLKLQEVINQGGYVGLMADRQFGSKRTLPVNFLGELANFPLTTWEVAALLKVPVISCFGLFSSPNRYDIFFQPLEQSFIDASRKDRPRLVELALHNYVEQLQTHVQMHPYNWFNFYDFWQHDAS